MLPDTAGDGVFQLDARVRLLPVVHGSGDCAVWVRREILARRWACLAVPLPPSFQAGVEAAVAALPVVQVVAAPEPERPDYLPGGGAADESTWSYVPVDPCQPVIAALRLGLEERTVRAFIDMEIERYESVPWHYPDAYALKTVHPARFAAALLPAVPPLAGPQQAARVAHMAHRLRDLASRHESVLALCSFLEWPWLREAYRTAPLPPEVPRFYAPPRIYPVRESTLAFVLGEIPYVTALYERSRRELRADGNLSIDGVKELLVETRERLGSKAREAGRAATPQSLSLLLTYARNLTLLGRRLTPDLFTLVLAAKQVVGDGFAIRLLEVAREYAYQGERPPDSEAAFGLGRAALPDQGVVSMVNRLPGSVVGWRHIELKPSAPRRVQARWARKWNPLMNCSWPPEDDRIEAFRSHVREQARSVALADLCRSEKFSTSLLDGIDIRETLRHWYEESIYVRRFPSARVDIEMVVFLFDIPADPDQYPWRQTWYAEHENESTLVFYATDFRGQLIGPGIAEALYGGAFFLFPPRPIPDIWRDPGLGKYDRIEERLLAGACLHSRTGHVALVSPCPLRARWRRLAREFRRTLVPLPLSRFNPGVVSRLRRFHVLNGRHVRSYAADFIRGDG